MGSRTVTNVSQSAEHSERAELGARLWKLADRLPREMRNRIRQSALNNLRAEGRPDVLQVRATHRKLRARLRRHARQGVQSPTAEVDRALFATMEGVLTHVESIAEAEASVTSTATLVRRKTFADTLTHWSLTREQLAEPPPAPRHCSQRVRRIEAAPRAPSPVQP